MDTVFVLIVTIFATAIINGIVSNIIFLRYQKKIEATFAKSQLEHEIKFVRNHAKMVETLETIYQRYSEFRLNANRLFMDRYSYLSDKEAFHKKATKIFRPTDELFDYFVSHNIYLPESYAVKIKDILVKSKLILTLTYFGFTKITRNDIDDVLPETLDLLPTMVSTWELDIDLSDEEKLFDEIIRILNEYSNTIEKFYRDAVKEN